MSVKCYFELIRRYLQKPILPPRVTQDIFSETRLGYRRHRSGCLSTGPEILLKSKMTHQSTSLAFIKLSVAQAVHIEQHFDKLCVSLRTWHKIFNGVKFKDNDISIENYAKKNMFETFKKALLEIFWNFY